MTYQLYYAPGSAAMGVRVLLEEIGARYTLLDTTIEMDAPRPAAQLALNPNGWVPVLIWEDRAMYECAAITIFLCDLHRDAGLAPALDAPERGLYLQTLVYFSNTLQTAFQQSYYPERFAETPEGFTGAQARANRRLRDTWGVINDQIGDNQWILGDRFSAADIYLYMLTTWLNPDQAHPVLDEFGQVARVARAVATRPAVQRVYGVD